MPLYEYQCTACGHYLEIIEKVTDQTERECPECSGEMERLLSAPAIQFKGSGWYITDYARKDGSATKGTEAKGESSTKTESGSDKSSDKSAKDSGTGSESSSKKKGD